MLGKIRIIAGQWRGRKLLVPDKPGLRPTPDRVRETLFNWLTVDLPGRRCLDLFAGSGALGLEAASRGAREVVLVEKDREIVQTLHQHILTFGASQVKVIHTDALVFLKRPPTPFEIVFLDPPFGYNLLPLCCTLLEEQGWLSPEAMVYIEMERQLGEPTFLPSTWQVVRRLNAGQVTSLLVRRR